MDLERPKFKKDLMLGWFCQRNVIAIIQSATWPSIFKVNWEERFLMLHKTWCPAGSIEILLNRQNSYEFKCLFLFHKLIISSTGSNRIWICTIVHVCLYGSSYFSLRTLVQSFAEKCTFLGVLLAQVSGRTLANDIWQVLLIYCSSQ